jgi:hypothetical protein
VTGVAYSNSPGNGCGPSWVKRVMHSRSEQYRRLGIGARQRAAEATDLAVRDAFEEVAVNWFALAEQVEWIEGLDVKPPSVDS